MAIPKSTIVMAALTCIPLGLAVRDYAKHGKTNPPHRHDDPYGEDAEIDPSELEEHSPSEAELEAEAKRAQVREEERKATRQQAFEQLLGSSPATLGRAFNGLQLGMTEAMLDNHYDEATTLRQLARDNDLLVRLDADNGVLNNIEISPYRGDVDATCEALHDYLTAHWKLDEAKAVYDDMVWQSQDGTRAELTADNTCTLAFRKFVPVETWIQKVGSPFPLWAIGQPSANLVKSIEPQRADLSNAPSSLIWTTVGAGVGIGAPKLVAYAKAGKIAAVMAVIHLHADTAEALTAQLDKLLGKHTESAGGALIWAKKPGAILEPSDRIDGDFTLTVGEIP